MTSVPSSIKSSIHFNTGKSDQRPPSRGRHRLPPPMPRAGPRHASRPAVPANSSDVPIRSNHRKQFPKTSSCHRKSLPPPARQHPLGRRSSTRPHDGPARVAARPVFIYLYYALGADRDSRRVAESPDAAATSSRHVSGGSHAASGPGSNYILRLQSVRANTCSRAAKNLCHPPLAPW
jgi:hypothetical protein